MRENRKFESQSKNMTTALLLAEICHDLDKFQHTHITKCNAQGNKALFSKYLGVLRLRVWLRF